MPFWKAGKNDDQVLDELKETQKQNADEFVKKQEHADEAQKSSLIIDNNFTPVEYDPQYILQVNHLKKYFPIKGGMVSKTVGYVKAVDGVTFNLKRGTTMGLVGESGCGKTTTLNMISGFLKPNGGRVLLDRQDITALPPERRPVSTVFQSYGLFPHMSVLQNVTYGLKFRGYSRAEAKEKGRRYLTLVGLAERENARIGELSGGQQQRVALARALIVEPKLCLLDEPLSNLDAALRVRMRGELKRLQRELGTTMVFVTHDQEEALILADSIAVMSEGELLQLGSAEEVFRHPANDYIASFLGLNDIVWKDDGSVLKVIRHGEKE